MIIKDCDTLAIVHILQSAVNTVAGCSPMAPPPSILREWHFGGVPTDFLCSWNLECVILNLSHTFTHEEYCSLHATTIKVKADSFTECTRILLGAHTLQF